jgi:hypothetical protein
MWRGMDDFVLKLINAWTIQIEEYRIIWHRAQELRPEELPHLFNVEVYADFAFTPEQVRYIYMERRRDWMYDRRAEVLKPFFDAPFYVLPYVRRASNISKPETVIRLNLELFEFLPNGIGRVDSRASRIKQERDLFVRRELQLQAHRLVYTLAESAVQGLASRMGAYEIDIVEERHHGSKYDIEIVEMPQSIPHPTPFDFDVDTMDELPKTELPTKKFTDLEYRERDLP